jgi:hypothetical protein
VNGQLLSPRQELTPAPYALSLRPGAHIYGDLPEPGLDVRNASGAAVQGHSETSYGVYGETLDATEFVAAGVYGYSTHEQTSGVMGRSELGFGVYGQILNPDSTHSAVVGYTEGQGNGISGVSAHRYGVYGVTEGDTEWQAAGVHGFSTHPRTFGVLGSSEWGIGVEGSIDNVENSYPAVVGLNLGGGPGVEGYAQNSDGVLGSTNSAAAYGGRFRNDAAGGAGVYARGESGPDLVLGGQAGVILSDPAEPSSGLRLNSLDYVAIDLDEDNDEEGHFSIWNGEDQEVFEVDEGGNVLVPGDLTVWGNLDTRGPSCEQFDVPGAGLHTIAVPDFCIDAMCWITVLSDGQFGAQGPGFFWPSMYMQRSSDNHWWAGPAINIAGITVAGGPGVNGDGASDGPGFGATTASGGELILWDDRGGENSPDLWTVEFQPRAGELTFAAVYVCPMGQPVAQP